MQQVTDTDLYENNQIVRCDYVFCRIFSCSQKQTDVVWNCPATESGNIYGDGYFKIAIDVVKVELKEDETVLHLNIQQHPKYKFRFAKDSYLATDSLHYMAVSADSIELGKWTRTNKDGHIDIALHFEPLPLDTKTFDFIEGNGKGAFFIKGIKPVEERRKQLFPSYWRNDKTGDWEIALLNSFAIYQCKFWNYKSCNVNKETDEAEIVMTNDENQLTVRVGKNRNGRRTMRIGRQKKTYSMITGRFLPDYPHQDKRTAFADNGYKADTVTIVGWLKDLPEKDKDKKTLEIRGNDFFSGEQVWVYAHLDGQGRFMAKVPVFNSTGFICWWNRNEIQTLFEPGKTYFMLYDFKEGRRMFMGDDVRLQNELFKFPINRDIETIQKNNYNYDCYIRSVDSLLNTRHAYINSLQKEHPSLSKRFVNYRHGETLWQQAWHFGQSQYFVPEHKFDEAASNYAYNTFWTKLPEPITLYGDFNTFFNDYISFISFSYRSLKWDILEHIDEYASNEEELELLRLWAAAHKEIDEKIDAAPTKEEQRKLAEYWNTKNADMIERAEDIINSPKNRRMVDGKFIISRLKTSQHILDSLNAPQLVKDVYLTRYINKRFENNHQYLSQEVIDTINVMVQDSGCLKSIEYNNSCYLALENGKFDKFMMKSNDDSGNRSEGEELLKKILEPFKGKIVLLDIWGTWCGPCRAALENSEEEYVRLAKYDIGYLYLANRSPKEMWEKIIKEYNVTGKNVSHYNLPEEQQSAIEDYLDIHGFPTYKLFDRDGNLLDLKVDARDIDDLENVIKRLSRK